MKNRLPIAVSVTALVVALLGTTGVAGAVQNAVSFAGNAGKLRGFAPSKTKKKNTVVVRGANGFIDRASIPPQARGARGKTGAPGQVGPEGPPNPNAVNAANADKLDGLDSTAFVQQTDDSVFAFGQIREDASIRSGSGRVISVNHPAAGQYCVNLSPVPDQTRREGTIVGLAGGGTTALFARIANGQEPFTCPTGGALTISIVNASGAFTNGRFSFIVP